VSTLIRDDVTPFTVGESVLLQALQVTDDTGTPIIAPNTATLQILRPDQTVAATLSLASITTDGAGNFAYSFFISPTEQYGKWSALWTFVNSSYTGNFGIPFQVNQFNAYGIGVNP
jgi:hypothetical protein